MIRSNDNQFTRNFYQL